MTKPEFRVSDVVRILDGPFTNFRRNEVAPPPAQTIIVEVGLEGHKVPVETDGYRLERSNEGVRERKSPEWQPRLTNVTCSPTQYDARRWGVTFYTTEMEHSPTSAPGTRVGARRRMATETSKAGFFTLRSALLRFRRAIVEPARDP